MTRFLILGTLLLYAASPAVAQTEGRVSVGGSIVFAKPTDSEVNSVLGGGLILRLNPKKGWGPTAASTGLPRTSIIRRAGRIPSHAFACGR